jgi:hypothetical protein
MANKFVSLLDHVGEGLKKLFTSPVALDIEDIGVSLAETAWPGLDALWTPLGAAIAKAQVLASAANTGGDTTAQVSALVLSDAQQVFQAYEQASGTKLESTQQEAIVQLFLKLLTSLPAPTNTAPAPAAPAAPSIQVVPEPVPAPIAAARPAAIAIGPLPTSVAQETPGAATPAAVIDGPGLHTVVPQ